MLLGSLESFCPSAAYSLIADYFPQEKRTTANAWFAGCIFVGASLSSLSALLIGSVGWRRTFAIVSF
jgi:MFS family permease